MTRTTCKLNPVQMAIQAAGGRKKLAESLTPPITRLAVELCRGSREYRSIFFLPCSKRSRDGGLRQHSLLLASAT